MASREGEEGSCPAFFAGFDPASSKFPFLFLKSQSHQPGFDLVRVRSDARGLPAGFLISARSKGLQLATQGKPEGVCSSPLLQSLKPSLIHAQGIPVLGVTAAKQQLGAAVVVLSDHIWIEEFALSGEEA